MKQRRTVIVCFLLVATLLLGVGYAAAATDTLTINGAASVAAGAVANAIDEDVYFSAVSPLPEEGEDEYVDPTTGVIIHAHLDSIAKPDMASFRLSNFTAADQSVQITYTVTNAGTQGNAVKVTPTVTGAGDYFTVTTSWDSAPGEIAASQTANVVVTVTLDTMPAEGVEVNTITVSLSAEYITQ